MHGRDKFVFLRSEYSALKCGNGLELGSLYMSFGHYLKTPANLGVRLYNKDIVRLKCIMYIQHPVYNKPLINSGSLTMFTGCHT